MKSISFKGQTFNKPGRAINLDQPKYDEVIIDGCTLEGTGGIFIQAKVGMKISITNCTVDNIIKGPGMEYAQFVQVSGCQPNERLYCVPINLHISSNQITNKPGVCDVEDVINLIMVGGSRTNPLVINNNVIQGASPKDMNPVSLIQYSGGGIICDRGTQYALIERNKVMETTNYGIGVAGGMFNVVRTNVVTATHAVNVGVYCYNAYPKDPFRGNVVLPSNAINWMTAKGRNDTYIAN